MKLNRATLLHSKTCLPQALSDQVNALIDVDFDLSLSCDRLVHAYQRQVRGSHSLISL